VVAVFVAAALLQVVAAQGARLVAQRAVPPVWEPERDVPQAAQPVAQAAQQDAPPVPGELLAVHSAVSLDDPRDALPVLAALLVARSVAWRADLLPDSVVAHSAVSPVDPQVALPVPGELPAARSVAPQADPQDALPVLAYSLAVHSAAPLTAAHSDVSPADLQGGRPDDCLAVRLADDHY
jgi:hypothetical protein